MKTLLHNIWIRISKKALEKEISEMEAKLEEQKKEIFRIKDADEIMQSDSDLGSYRKYLFRRMPLQHLDSVFMTRRDKLIPKVTATFEPTIMRHICQNLSDKNEAHIFTMALYCSDVIMDRNGARLVLEDPYRRIMTQPLKLTAEEAEELMGMVVLTKVELCSNSYNHKVTEFKVSAIRKTVYSWFEEYKNGIASPIAMEPALNRYYLLKNIRGVAECRLQLDRMEAELARIGNRIETYAFRKSEDILYIRRKGLTEILYQVNGKLEYAFEPQEKGRAQEVREFFDMAKGRHLGKEGLELDIFNEEHPENMYIRIMDSTFERDTFAAV